MYLLVHQSPYRQVMSSLHICSQLIDSLTLNLLIVLSANGDTKMVMKGITHGACDYLLKPIRLEELKNIWQHVIRKKKVEKKDQSEGKREKRSCPADEGQKCSAVGDSDQDGRNCKRRKDQSEDDDDEETDENGHEDDDPSSQKKSRVVWSVDLHRKFVAAVNQLGFDSKLQSSRFLMIDGKELLAF